MSIIRRELLERSLETYKARAGWGREISKEDLPVQSEWKAVRGDGWKVSRMGVEKDGVVKKFADGKVYWGGLVLGGDRVVVHTVEIIEEMGEEEEEVRTSFLTEYRVGEGGEIVEGEVDTGSLSIVNLDTSSGKAVLGFDTDAALCSFHPTTLYHEKHFEGLNLIATTRPSAATLHFSLPNHTYAFLLEPTAFTTYARATPTSPIGNQATTPLSSPPMSITAHEISTGGCRVEVVTQTAKHVFEFSEPTEVALPSLNGVDPEQMARISAVLSSGGEW